MSFVTRAAAVAAFLLASACSGEPEILEPDPSASSSVDQELSEPGRPRGLDDATESGAATFALYWVQVSDYAAATGDTSRLAEISAKSCDPCNDFINLYRTTHKAGGSFSGGKQDFADVSVRRVSANKMFVYAKVTAQRGLVKSSSDASPSPEPGGTDSVVYTVVRSGSEWKMAHQALEASQ